MNTLIAVLFGPESLLLQCASLASLVLSMAVWRRHSRQQASLVTIEANLVGARRQAASEQVRATALETQLAKIKTDSLSWEAKFAEKDEAIHELMQKVSAFRRSHTDAAAECEVLRKQLAAQVEELTELRDRVSAQEHEMSTSQSNIDSARSALLAAARLLEDSQDVTLASSPSSPSSPSLSPRSPHSPHSGYSKAPANVTPLRPAVRHGLRASQAPAPSKPDHFKHSESSIEDFEPASGFALND